MKSFYRYLAGALASLLIVSCGEKPEAKSRDHMHEFHSALMVYREENDGLWPEAIDELREYVEDYDGLMVNPVTGDNPGYQYNAPPEGADPDQEIGGGGGSVRIDPDTGEEIAVAPKEEGGGGGRKPVIVQLRNGQPDPSLKALYIDGSVRK